MAIHITQIDKYSFVCGLFWQSLSRPREMQREAAELGKRIDSDLVVIRHDHSTAQAGFGHTRDGATNALYSLAAVVSKTLALEGAWYDGVLQPVHNWLGVFRLPDERWAYFAVRDANFLPNGDFAGSREEVLERLHNDYGLGGWNVVIGDPELETLGFHNFNARTIETLLAQRKDGSVRVYSWSRLRQINRRRPSWALAAGGVALAASACGAVLYWQSWQAHQRDIEQARLLEEARLVSMRQLAPVQPWVTLARPAVTLQRCADQLVHLTPGGWSLDEYVCDGAGQHYAWSRKGSTVQMLRSEVPGAQVATSGDKAILVQPIANGPRLAGSAEALLPTTRVLDAVMSRLQGVGVQFKVMRRDAPLPVPGAPGAAGVPAMAPPWQVHAFALEARGLEPQQIATLLDQPGVRVEKATYRGMGWLIEGVIYGK